MAHASLHHVSAGCRRWEHGCGEKLENRGPPKGSDTAGKRPEPKRIALKQCMIFKPVSWFWDLIPDVSTIEVGKRFTGPRQAWAAHHVRRGCPTRAAAHHGVFPGVPVGLWGLFLPSLVQQLPARDSVLYLQQTEQLKAERWLQPCVRGFEPLEVRLLCLRGEIRHLDWSRRSKRESAYWRLSSHLEGFGGFCFNEVLLSKSSASEHFKGKTS